MDQIREYIILDQPKLRTEFAPPPDANFKGSPDEKKDNKSESTDDLEKALKELGNLKDLPRDVLGDILSSFFMPTLEKFRGLNSQTKSMVNHVAQYNAINKHCRTIIDKTVDRKVQIRLHNLYFVLSNPACSQPNCPFFGEFLNLASENRLCLKHANERIILPGKRVAGLTGYTQEKLKTIKHIYNESGSFLSISMSTSGEREREMIFDRQVVLDAATAESDWPLARRLRKRDLQNDSNTLPSSDVMIEAPFFNYPGQEPEWGFRCALCMNHSFTRHWRSQKSKYTEREFVRHFEIHGLAVDDGGGRNCHSQHLPGGSMHEEIQLRTGHQDAGEYSD